MKIAGIEKLEVNCGVCRLIRGDVELPLLVTPLPSGWRARLSAVGILVWPTAPKKPLKDGKRYVTGSNGRVEVVADETDPEYIAGTSKVINRMQALNLAEVLRNETTVEFEHKKPTTDDKEAWATYADGLVEEVRGSGLTDGEIEMILQFAASLGTSVDIGKAAEAF